MNSVAVNVKKISEGAYFVLDTMAYLNQVTPFHLILSTQTISSVPMEVPLSGQIPEELPEPTEE